MIYADPPWRYAQKGLQGAAEKHYPTMGIDELCTLPVANLAAPDSVLFLWATFPQLPEALRLIREWGFTYKSVAFVWLKKNRKADSWFYGLGFWTRANAEVCLLATRGHPKRQAANIHQFIISPIEAHSKKPDEARDKIVALMGDLPRVELFARQTPPGQGNIEPALARAPADGQFADDARFTGKGAGQQGGQPRGHIGGNQFLQPMAACLHAPDAEQRFEPPVDHAHPPVGVYAQRQHGDRVQQHVRGFGVGIQGQQACFGLAQPVAQHGHFGAQALQFLFGGLDGALRGGLGKQFRLRIGHARR